MYQEFKDRLISEMEQRRDMLVVNSRRSAAEPLFEVSTDDDKLYQNILKEFDLIAVRNSEKLLYDLCHKYGIRTKTDYVNDHRFDLEIEREGDPFYVDLKTSARSFSPSSRTHIVAEMMKEADHPVCVALLLKDSSEARKEQAFCKALLEKRGLSYPDVRVVLFEDLIEELFGDKELKSFREAMLTFKEQMHEAIGYQITEIFNEYNLQKLKDELKHEITSFDYRRIREERFAELKAVNPGAWKLHDHVFDAILDKFLDDHRYRLLLGNGDFARSFMTSEWLYRRYFSLKDMDNTFIVAGYLKSIEQLLWDIISNVGTGRMIREVEINGENSDGIDSTLGALQRFISDFGNTDLYEPVFAGSTSYVMLYLKNQLNSWRESYRNGYFHKDNLDDEKKILAIREETLFLYMLILGSVKIDEALRIILKG